jgi:hypothetical protein
MTGQIITFTNGINEYTKFDRLSYDRRLKLFQITGYTSTNNRFSGFNNTVLYEVVSETDTISGSFIHQLYGGFYQGFYRLFGYDYNIFPERMNKGWSVEMLLKPRFVDEYVPSEGETTLNLLYPNNKDIFFYFGTRAENKFYHYADGHPRCLTGYTRITSSVTGITTCACCDNSVVNSRCIFIYPPRPTKSDCDGCITCGWEYKLHDCPTVTPTPTPTPVPTPSNCEPISACTPGCSCLICTSCNTCETCDTCNLTPGSVENTCESDPLFDSMSNVFALKLCGDPHNPQIGIRILRFTGDCATTGSCSTTGVTYTTGYTVDNYCTPNSVYDYCSNINPAYLEIEHWFHVTAVWERYTWLNTCDLWYRGGLGDITQKKYLDGLAGNSVELITVPYTQTCGSEPQKIDLVSLNEKWLVDKDFRKGRLKIYVNGRRFHTFENIEEIIPRALSTDKEKQVGVPYNISWGGGTQGLRENLTFSSTTGTSYVQDPECLPTNDFIGTDFEGFTTDILIEENFAGSFDGGISQFRLYIEPLSADEVKHNFNLLKDTFDMFNPDCPDCGENFCPTNDFTFEITPSEQLPQFQLGRIHIPDERDNNYLIKDHFLTIKDRIVITPTPTPTKTKTPTPTKSRSITPTPTPTNVGITSKYWDDNVWWGNQGNTPMCVGYAWAHWIADGPVTHTGVQPPIAPNLIYYEAQKVDEWPGENYDGTSVRGGAKYLTNSGKVGNYYWAYDVQTLINTILQLGPVVVGTNWYYNMFYPNSNGVISIGGSLAGGHAYVINGVDTVNKLFRIKNSWGQSWGKSGHAFITFTNMTRLINEHGEICLAIENNF